MNKETQEDILNLLDQLVESRQQQHRVMRQLEEYEKQYPLKEEDLWKALTPENLKRYKQLYSDLQRART